MVSLFTLESLRLSFVPTRSLITTLIKEVIQKIQHHAVTNTHFSIASLPTFG